MIAQLLIASTEIEESFITFLNQTLLRSGYKVKIIPILKAVVEKNHNLLTGDLSLNVDLTLVTSGLLWMYLTNLPVDRSLFPNTIVITSNPDLQYSWTLKPIIVIWRLGEPFVSKLGIAMEDIKSKPRRNPEWAGSYKQMTYGWLLRNADEEPFALGAWQKLKEYIWPGYIFTTWSKNSQLYDHKFKVTAITDTSVIIESSIDKSTKTINQKEFLEVARGWKDYNNGKIPDKYLQEKTTLFLYVLGVLHWLDEEGRLRNLPEN